MSFFSELAPAKVNLTLRILGKRELGQMSLYDLVLIIILGNDPDPHPLRCCRS